MKILIVEDEPLIARNLAHELEDLEYEVAAVCFTYLEAIRALEEKVIDFAFLDIYLGGDKNGIDLSKIVNEQYKIPFVFLTSYSDKKTIDIAKYSYPMAYLIKPYDERELKATIEISAMNYSTYHNNINFDINSLNAKLLSRISHKEFEVLTDIYKGLTNQRIAKKHFISMSTVKTHINHIFDKIDVSSRTELIVKLRDWC